MLKFDVRGRGIANDGNFRTAVDGSVGFGHGHKKGQGLVDVVVDSRIEALSEFVSAGDVLVLRMLADARVPFAAFKVVANRQFVGPGTLRIVDLQQMLRGLLLKDGKVENMLEAVFVDCVDVGAVNRSSLGSRDRDDDEDERQDQEGRDAIHGRVEIGLNSDALNIADAL